MLARTILADSDAEQLSQNTTVTEFEPDSYVLVAQRSSLETRLHTLWCGPMWVISDRGAYTLLDLTTNKEKQYHATQLKQFLFNPSRTDPLDVARKNYLEFFVEAVLSHTGLSDKISTLKFHIKWLGYDESHNTWEPWSNVRDMKILHRYLIQKNLRRLIPLKFEGNYRDLIERVAEEFMMDFSPYFYPQGFGGVLVSKSLTYPQHLQS
jgi:Chromo (CHRromatin Organisation MOdifier) domain